MEFEELSTKVNDLDFILNCQNSFPFFMDNVLGFKMAKFQIEQFSETSFNRYVCIINPIGHSKTTVYGVGYPIWKLWKERDFEICSISSSLDQSKKTTDIVQQTIETNPFLKHLVPKGNDLWNRTEFMTTNRNRYYTKPFNSTIRGVHPNLLICDDLLRETDTPMSEIISLFWSIVYGRVQSRKGQLVVIGTPQSEDDLYLGQIRVRAAKEGSHWKYLHQSAVKTDGQGLDPSHWIEPLWPERFTMDELKQIREDMGTYAFNREYMCSPSGEGSQLYLTKDLSLCCFNELTFQKSADLSYGPVYVGCDFATSTSVSGDYSVFTVVQQLNSPIVVKAKTLEGVEYDKVINEGVRILHIERHHGMPTTLQTERVVSLYKQYGASRVIVDQSNIGANFLQDLKNSYINVDGQNMQPVARASILLNLTRFIESRNDGSHRLIIPTSQEDPNTYLLSTRLLKELESFKETKTRMGSATFQSDADHDDMVMSLALAVRDISAMRMGTARVLYSSSLDGNDDDDDRVSEVEKFSDILEKTSEPGRFKIITR